MGLTSAVETAEVSAWAKQYPELVAEIEAIQSGLESYAQTHAVTPATSVKEKLFAAINTNERVYEAKADEKTTAKVYRISPAWKYAAAASVILLVGSLILSYVFYNKYQSANAELANAKTELEQQIAMVNNMQNELGVITNKDAMHVKLDGMPDVPEAVARIYWMQNTKEVYIDPSNLPQAPAGKQYQFWAIVDGKPVNGGIITTQINGKTVHVQKMKSFGSAQAFAVSLEDAGPEKPVPTKVMAMGKM
jgi:hypothetical protein